MGKVMKTVICTDCLNPVTSAGCTSVDIVASSKVELMDKFCYPHDKCGWSECVSTWICAAHSC